MSGSSAHDILLTICPFRLIQVSDPRPMLSPLGSGLLLEDLKLQRSPSLREIENLKIRLDAVLLFDCHGVGPVWVHNLCNSLHHRLKLRSEVRLLG